MTSGTFTRIANEHRDGCVLLSTASDRIFKLNGMGALTWALFQQIPGGLSTEQVVHDLRQQFEVINTEGGSLYEVPPDKLHAETSRFLNSLVEMRLLQVTLAPDGQKLFRISEDVSATTSATLIAPDREQNPSPSDRALTPPVTETKPLKRETLMAFIGLFAFDLVLRFAGFQSLITKVERWPISRSRRIDLEACRRVRAMVDRAQVYYPKKAMCLQHSAVVTCLLRRRGIPAQMVLAAQDFPPKGHAWVEVEGEVINDKPAVRQIYRTLRRV